MMSALLLSSALTEPLPALLPGQWQIQAEVRIDGRSLQQELGLRQQVVLQWLQPAQRQKILSVVPNQLQQPLCLRPANAKALQQPHNWQLWLSQQFPHCQWHIKPKANNNLHVSGQCQAPSMFRGALQGNLYLLTSTKIHLKLAGNGQVDLPTSPSTWSQPLQLTANAHWQSAQCPN